MEASSAAAHQGRARLVIASNRGPVERRRDADGRVVRHRGAGGLIAVLGPALASYGGVWVASALTGEDRAAAGRVEGVELPEGPIGVRLLAHGREDYASYYGTVSTELLWFVQHQLPLPGGPVSGAALRPHWAGYRRVNDAFARGCAEAAAPGGTVLLQDYHLSLAPRRLRALRPDVRSAHFTMTPWAEPDRFEVLPAAVRRELVDGLLGADLVCFLVPRWAEAFLACCERLGLAVDRRRRAVRGGDGRWSGVRCFPVGVDAGALLERAAADDVRAHERQLRGAVGEDVRLVVRVDRMEPSKNILRGLRGFARFLELHPEQHGRVVHFVLAYASRADLAAYRTLTRQVTELAREIDARYGRPGWRPVLLETHNDFGRGLAAMAQADVLVVNPVRDGMNLVAKEGVVVSRRDLALVLSREAGAADDLAEGCRLVDPFDVRELAEAIDEGLTLPGPERTTRLDRLRKGAVALPPDQWLRAALAELTGAAGA
ncbi:trehalose-6-phosphate synthase [Streptomyces sp. LHD-70]|uniref:alpha,alpha-trehalose-phosphate synthase (UDP-forming) n=1 Tax=Streptomyces sp. LHD-70 TaxID=3072140 RepID=UPI00280E48BF|nr:trehalose-6-phosphate synthase [Streptomyces sp. LHD-70]MDQ8706935.1 trehalose-6-phosphate synthase [Streptomyces sp. LHD-70]